MFAPVLKELGIPFSSYITPVNKIVQETEWLEGWKKSLGADQKSLLDVTDFEGAAVIGFEVAEKDLAWLNANGIPWMNVAIHPIRFLDDLYIEISTSFPYDFSSCAASAGLIDVWVQALRIRYRAVAQQTGPDTLAIFGQTPFDRSVYFDGDFRSLNDHIDALDELASGHERIIYKPHPYATDTAVTAMIEKRYGAEIYTQRDIYEFFVSRNITTACAISSSVLVEAPYFGITAEYLEPKAKKFGPPISYRALLDDLTFWNRLLGQEHSPRQGLKISQAVPENHLRKFYLSWGFITDDEWLERKIVQDVGLKTHDIALKVRDAELKIHDIDLKFSEEQNFRQQDIKKIEILEQKLKIAEQNTDHTAELARQALDQADQYSKKMQETLSQLNAVYASTSWRLMAPLRGASRLLRKHKTKTPESSTNETKPD